MASTLLTYLLTHLQRAQPRGGRAAKVAREFLAQCGGEWHLRAAPSTCARRQSRRRRAARLVRVR
eukprot:scaffold74159_cov39-Phaeocystis_antarctica.AAC.1